MKPIRILDGAPSGLSQYLAQPHPNQSWTHLRNHAGSWPYLQLRGALVQRQHGLCGYCEQTIPSDDCQVEHVIPQSHTTNGNQHDLDHTNMIACCLGGTAVNLYGKNTTQPDPDRVGDLSCGQAKNNIHDTHFIDPRNLPVLRSLFRVRSNGKIDADEEACRKTGISKSDVERTIEILGLNVGRLKRARSKRWNTINELYRDHLSNPDVMRRAAQAELLPDGHETLPRFFTTNRSYFGPHNDRAITHGNTSWV